ncbi:unnamed protein product, partial [Heligmosomoides polygyrus]|uniref:LLGL domain-containing protein n=1 Tax=Heligmosomoides polygyrus TaxID=6339 RepID=A0A183GQL3_HELPZ
FCPVLYTEEIAVVIKKGFKETIIQVGAGPCAAYFERSPTAPNDGYLTLSGLQFRGHAMFSPIDCPWDMAVVEYCWLTEILVGEVGGCFGCPSQIITLVNFLDTLILLLVAKDDAKIVPERFKFCQHGQTSSVCTIGSQPGRPCDSEDRLKYTQMRLSVDGVQLALADENTAITVALDPLRFTLCNAHEKRLTEHICLRIPNVVARQCRRIFGVYFLVLLCQDSGNSGKQFSGSVEVHQTEDIEKFFGINDEDGHLLMDRKKALKRWRDGFNPWLRAEDRLFYPADSPTWLECARASITGVSLDVELPYAGGSSQLDQMRQKFLLKHDKETKRLHFLWDKTTVWSCACYGDTAFITKDDTL